jgi:hypothetical protein
LPAVAAHLACLSGVGLVLIAAGQPIFVEDTWWHLAIGDAYASSGPWLNEDPFLFAAQGPPAPAAWLTDVVFHWVHTLGGFHGLRAAHVLLVALILWLAWTMLERVSDSKLFASLGTSIFALMCAYRLFQLRPHLFSILAGLLLIRLLILDGAAPSRRRIFAATVLMILWGNAHGAFILGPVLLASAIAGVVAAALLWPEDVAKPFERARQLAIALVLGGLGTLLNPMGIGMHLLYFTAGEETPDLSVVADEWAPVALLQLPLPNLPPTPLSWIMAWGLVIATPFAAWLLLQALRTPPLERKAARPDPALIALAGAALIGMLSAVRLLWLAIFPLLLVGAALRQRAVDRGEAGPRPIAALAAALVSLALVPGFLYHGDWPMISKGIHRAWYARAYSATKFHAHAVWFMKDAGLEGRLFNDYSTGNFLGYWVTPQLRVFINGSLNVPLEVMNASRSLMGRTGSGDGQTFLELLDEQGIDVFFGVGTPWLSLPGRPTKSTTTHLEHASGWTPVFRNMRSAVYIRDSERNRANFERVARYYAAAGVPFDPERGFDPASVARQAPGWSIEHGLIPMGIQHASAALRSGDPEVRRQAQNYLAAVYAVAGLYERAVEIDRQLLRKDPEALRAGRRLVWSLLHLRRFDEALAASHPLARNAAPGDALSRALVRAARLAESSSDEDIASLISMLPVLERPEGHRVYAGYREPSARLD